MPESTFHITELFPEPMPRDWIRERKSVIALLGGDPETPDNRPLDVIVGELIAPHCGNCGGPVAGGFRHDVPAAQSVQG